ncbi:hypothetical protein BVER_00214 [Candidatus Burkholderia verschuerenii]|uniref:Lipoprotein n=1 Tax=Candidatus Burkholderia verschuerenii TaxID=242163 RepID=A0A0L0MBY8_9BURK|nr:hypothetical protein [Candidatus Burkholderia verschuerenii]KND60222.1 hypothetical protein BVER_00214 [Candidatus Burkholderia verschuerenii]
MTKKLKTKLTVGLTAIGAMILTGCISTEDALLKSVPVGSGVSQRLPYDFIKCVKAKWLPLDPRVREYSMSADSQAVSIPGKGYASQSVVLAVAQQSANGTGYTIYGDIAVASRFVTAAHMRLIPGGRKAQDAGLTPSMSTPAICVPTTRPIR